jgi:hypothetical protein
LGAFWGSGAGKQLELVLRAVMWLVTWHGYA